VIGFRKSMAMGSSELQAKPCFRQTLAGDAVENRQCQKDQHGQFRDPLRSVELKPARQFSEVEMVASERNPRHCIDIRQGAVSGRGEKKSPALLEPSPGRGRRFLRKPFRKGIVSC
jgi:hypothetical protein